MNLARWILRVCGSVDRRKSSGTGSAGQDWFLVAIHWLKFFSAQSVVFVVFSGTSPSASLASSWSLVSANRPDEHEGWGSVRVALAFDGRSCSSRSGCGSKLITSAFPGQSVQEHMPRQVGFTEQANVSLVPVSLSQAIIF